MCEIAKVVGRLKADLVEICVDNLSDPTGPADPSGDNKKSQGSMIVHPLLPRTSSERAVLESPYAALRELFATPYLFLGLGHICGAAMHR